MERGIAYQNHDSQEAYGEVPYFFDHGSELGISRVEEHQSGKEWSQRVGLNNRPAVYEVYLTKITSTLKMVCFSELI